MWRIWKFLDFISRKFVNKFFFHYFFLFNEENENTRFYSETRALEKKLVLGTNFQEKLERLQTLLMMTRESIIKKVNFYKKVVSPSTGLPAKP